MYYFQYGQPFFDIFFIQNSNSTEYHGIKNEKKLVLVRLLFENLLTFAADWLHLINE